MELAEISPGTFRVTKGLLEGYRFVVRRVPMDAPAVRRHSIGGGMDKHELPDLGEGWRHAGGNHASIEDLEGGFTYEPMTTLPPSMSHHQGHDVRRDLETYFALLAVERVIAGENRLPMVSSRDLATLRSLVPDMPDPSPRAPLWPDESGVWSEDVADLWVLHTERADKRSRWRVVEVASLKFALLSGGASAVRWAGLMSESGGRFRGYGWYKSLPMVGTIRLFGAKAKRLAKEPGVHVVPGLSLQVSVYGDSGRRRQVAAPLWLEDKETLLVSEGHTPTAEEVTQLMRALPGYDRYDLERAMRESTELLGKATEADTRAELEAKLTRELAERLGGELDVQVIITPKGEGET